MHIWISGGGTAGHVYPALTVLDALADRARTTWFGSAASMEERIVAARGLPFVAVSSGPIVGADPKTLVRSGLRIAQGTWATWRRLRRSRRSIRAVEPRDSSAMSSDPTPDVDRPDVVFVTGGYVCVPVAIAARLAGVPLMAYLPDVVPGQAIRVVAWLADRIAVSHGAALSRLPYGKAVVTGYPVRPAVRAARRDASRERLGLSPEGRVLLVFGGSQGARRLNLALAEAAPDLLPQMEIVHLVGTRHLASSLAAADTLPADLRRRYRVYDYLQDEDMAAALAGADLVVSRAGASCLGEYPALGLPSILVPLPISGGHQWPNARVLAEAGAARIVADEALDGLRLKEEVFAVLGDEDLLSAMRRAARLLDQPNAAHAIADELQSLATPAFDKELAA